MIKKPRHPSALINLRAPQQRRPIRFQLIRDHHAGSPALPLQQLAQQPLGRLLVAPALDQNVQHDAVWSTARQR